MQLNEANSYCQSLNANQILPRTIHESDDLVSALLSLDLASEDGKTLVSIGISMSKNGQWHDSTGQLVTYFNWLPDKPDSRWNSTIKEFEMKIDQNYAGFRIDGVNDTGKWSDYNKTDQLNVVCKTTAGNGK